jgi:DNA modification methylase
VTALVLRGDALHLPLADASVDLAIFSPPYWALRSYDTGGDARELGSEAHWRDWLANLIAVTAEVARVLKPSGSIFVNCGDKYSSAAGPQTGEKSLQLRAGSPGKPAGPKWATTPRGQAAASIPEKSLLLLPERYRIAVVDQLGLVARAVIVWDKPNGLPESVRDRVRRSHEDWVHLTKGPRYYAATDEIREPHAPGNQARSTLIQHRRTVAVAKATPLNGGTGEASTYDTGHPLGKLPGSVWSIPSEPLQVPVHLGVDHYAAFPTEWPRRLILGWSPPGICTACGQGRWPVVEREQRDVPGGSKAEHGREHIVEMKDGARIGRMARGATEATILGYACACTPWTDHPERARGRGFIPDPDDRTAGASANGAERNRAYRKSLVNPPLPVREYHLDRWTPPPSRPSVVLDCFGGTGTTAGVARQLGRIGISLDLSHSYCRLARWRIHESGDFGKAEARTWRDRQGSLL